MTVDMDSMLYGASQYRAGSTLKPMQFFFCSIDSLVIYGHLEKFKKMRKDQRDQTSDTLQINESYLGPILEWLKISNFSRCPYIETIAVEFSFQ